MAQDKFIIKNGAVIESVLAGETVFDVQKTDKNSIFDINSNGTINLIGDINPSGNFINKLKISNGGISVTGVTTGETIFYDSTGGIVLKGKNTGDQDLSNLSTYTYVDNTFLKLAGGTMTGSLYVNNSTNSTNTTTGAIRTAGGLGVVGNAYFGGTVTTSAIHTSNDSYYSLIQRNGGGNALFVQQSSTSVPNIASFRYGGVGGGAGTEVLGVSSTGININGTATISDTATISGTITAQNGIVTDYYGSHWLSMATRVNQIRGDVNASATQAHSLYCVKNSNGDAIAFGGLGVNTGFYGFSASRIANSSNGTDWSTAWDVSTGMLNHTGNFYAGGFISSNNYITSSNRIFTGYDSGAANSMSCSGWFRSNGSSGWLNATYGGGMYQDDSTYVKVYGNKAFKVISTASDSINTSGGILASGDINVSGVVGFGTNKCQMSYNSTENSIDFIIN